MNTFSRVAIATLTMVGMSGVAMADTPAKADPKAAKADPKAPAGGDKKDAAPAMQMPKPAPEIADRLKMMQGTWTCTGTAMGGADMKTEMKFKGTMTSKSDLDGFWIHDSMQGTAGEGKAAMKFKMESYATFDAAGKKWHTLAVMNDGGQMVGMGDALKDGKGEMVADTWSPMGAGQMKDHVDVSDVKKAGAHMWGEASMDKGKTWGKVYDMTCKK